LFPFTLFPRKISIFVPLRIVMELFLITFVLLSLAFAGISIKIWAKKDGKFSGTCASQSPFLNKDNQPCGMCGKMPEEADCKNPSATQSNLN
jgi:hypothetical protein